MLIFQLSIKINPNFKPTNGILNQNSYMFCLDHDLAQENYPMLLKGKVPNKFYNLDIILSTN